MQESDDPLSSIRQSMQAEISGPRQTDVSIGVEQMEAARLAQGVTDALYKGGRSEGNQALFNVVTLGLREGPSSVLAQQALKQLQLEGLVSSDGEVANFLGFRPETFYTAKAKIDSRARLAPVKVPAKQRAM